MPVFFILRLTANRQQFMFQNTGAIRQNNERELLMSAKKSISTIAIVFVVIVFCFIFILKLFFSDLSEVDVTPWRIYLKFKVKGDEIAFREHPESSVISNKESEISRLKKQRIVDLAIMTVATPTWQLKDSPITIDLAESLKDLRISDPDSEIISLTEDFLLESVTGEDAMRSKIITDVWQKPHNE